MVKAGIIDPAKVTRSALQNAASIAGMLLTTECIVTDIPEKKDGPAGGGGGGMGGGMGGMGGMGPSTYDRIADCTNAARRPRGRLVRLPARPCTTHGHLAEWRHAQGRFRLLHRLRGQHGHRGRAPAAEVRPARAPQLAEAGLFKRRSAAALFDGDRRDLEVLALYNARTAHPVGPWRSSRGSSALRRSRGGDEGHGRLRGATVELDPRGAAAAPADHPRELEEWIEHGLRRARPGRGDRFPEPPSRRGS